MEVDHDMNGISTRLTSVWIVLGFLALIGILAIEYLLFQRFGSAGVEAVTTTLKVGLSGLLVLLYYRQTSIQREQKAIMDSQQQLHRAERRPNVEVEGYRIGDGPGDYSVEPLELQLSNIGSSPAEDLRIEFSTGFLETAPLRSGRTTLPLLRLDRSSDWHRDWGSYLEANKRDIEFAGEPLMLGWFDNSGNPNQIGLGLAHEKLSDAGVDDQIRLKATLLYTGVEGDEYREPIFDYVSDIVAYGGIRHVLENGRRYSSVYEKYLIPEEVSQEIFPHDDRE